MSQVDDFPSLIKAVRRGDADAAARLVKNYENELRIICRVKLTDPRLRRVVDSMDICQSVLGNFFCRVSAGQFDLDSPEQVMGLLAQMVRNKVTENARRQFADRRNLRRVAEVDIYEQNVAADQDTPSQIIAAKELAQKVREHLSLEERQLVELRTDGNSWEEISQQFGGSPDAIRKQMSRALNRVAKELGLAPTDED